MTQYVGIEFGRVRTLWTSGRISSARSTTIGAFGLTNRGGAIVSAFAKPEKAALLGRAVSVGNDQHTAVRIKNLGRIATVSATRITSVNRAAASITRTSDYSTNRGMGMLTSFESKSVGAGALKGEDPTNLNDKHFALSFKNVCGYAGTRRPAIPFAVIDGSVNIPAGNYTTPTGTIVPVSAMGQGSGGGSSVQSVPSWPGKYKTKQTAQVIYTSPPPTSTGVPVPVIAPPAQSQVEQDDYTDNFKLPSGFKLRNGQTHTSDY